MKLSNAPHPKKRKWIWAVLPASVLAVLLTIILYGTTTERTGWITVGPPIESSTTAFTYQSRLTAKSSLFRGNDLFRVSSLTINDPSEIIESQSHKVHEQKGAIEYKSFQRLNEGEKLSAVYTLDWRSEKILPALAIAAISLVALFLISSGPQLTGKNGLLLQPKVRIAAQLALLVVLSMLVWFNVGNPGWSYGDNHQFLTSTVRGKFLPPTVYPHIGRFFPLGLIEMNCLIPFGDNPLVYHLERSLLLCLAAGAMYWLLTRITNVGFSCFLLVLFLLTPELFRVFSESIFAEALLIVCLVSFWLFYHKAQESKNVLVALAACGFAAIATYCKEPVFGLFLIFALVQLRFGWERMNRKVLSINVFLLVNAFVFAGVYWWFCSAGESYAELRNAETGYTRISLFLNKCQHPFFLLAMLTGCYRLFCLTILRDKRLVFSDGALLAGLAYFGAYILLRLDADYYLVPAYVGWTIAFAGYLEHLSHIPALDASQFLTKKRTRILSFTLGALALCMILRIPTTQKCIANVVEARSQSVLLSRMFAELKQSGYEMAVYYAPDAHGHEKAVQDWRLTVLNVFDANLDTTSEVEQDYRTGPFKNKQLEELKTSQRKSVVICPPGDVETLRRNHTALGNYKQVPSVPNVMGAWMYTQSKCIDEVERIADRSRTLR